MIKQNANSRDVSNINIKSWLHNTAYNVYDKLLTTHNIRDWILKSLDFFVFSNFITCGKYDIIVHVATIHNKIFHRVYWDIYYKYIILKGDIL